MDSNYKFFQDDWKFTESLEIEKTAEVEKVLEAYNHLNLSDQITFNKIFRKFQLVNGKFVV